MKEITIDASGLVSGRLAAYCAKNALRGYTINIYNIEKAVISGNALQIVRVYTKRREMTNHANPEKAMKWPRRPDYLFRKVISGMLPAGKRGKQALRNIKSYIGEGPKKGTRPVKDSKALQGSFITLGQLSQSLGWSAQ
ncbi:MAG: uL13 family ribosomal protein [Candidatus Micrarchaeota archaeon]